MLGFTAIRFEEGALGNFYEVVAGGSEDVLYVVGNLFLGKSGLSLVVTWVVGFPGDGHALSDLLMIMLR